MSDKRIKYIMKNGKMIHPNLVDGCIAYYDFTLQTNDDNNRTMTPDLSGNENHMYHNNMLYDEVKLERLHHSTFISEIVGKNKKGYYIYKYTPKTRTSNTHVLYDLVPRMTLKDKQTISATIHMKYQGNADKLKPSIRLYKSKDENGEDIDLSGMVTLNETMEQDAEGFYKLSASYTNNTGADITNVSIVVYCANSTTSHLEDGHKPVTYFYIDSIDDGVTSLRSGFFPQNSGEGYSSGLVYDGIDDISLLGKNIVKRGEPRTVIIDFYLDKLATEIGKNINLTSDIYIHPHGKNGFYCSGTTNVSSYHYEIFAEKGRNVFGYTTTGNGNEYVAFWNNKKKGEFKNYNFVEPEVQPWKIDTLGYKSKTNINKLIVLNKEVSLEELDELCTKFFGGGTL